MKCGREVQGGNTNICKLPSEKNRELWGKRRKMHVLTPYLESGSHWHWFHLGSLRSDV